MTHSLEGCGPPADDAGVRPARPFLRVVAVVASAIVQRPLPKASQRARFNEVFSRNKRIPLRMLGRYLTKGYDMRCPIRVRRGRSHGGGKPTIRTARIVFWKADINQFLWHLAVKEHVASSTQNQALSAILFPQQERWRNHRFCFRSRSAGVTM